MVQPMDTPNRPGPIDDRFDAVAQSQWTILADAWLSELNDDSTPSNEYADKVTYMKFMARPEHLWNFILLATDRAETDYQLGHIAAGLVERLLGQYGNDYIESVERHGKANPKFARMLTGVSQYLIADRIWKRVQRLQALCPDQLVNVNQHEEVIVFEERHLKRLKDAKQERIRRN